MEPRHYTIENARLVLRDRVVEQGWMAVSDGKITEIGEGRVPEHGLNVHGDTIIPGLIELHTDHLETHFQPRPKVHWPAISAVLSYDAQIASNGITTVFDSLRAGTDTWDGQHFDGLETLGAAIDEARSADLLRAEHLTHLRCEIASQDVVEAVEAFRARRPVHLMSLMDHTPGQRQFQDIEKLLVYYRGKKNMSEADLQSMIVHRVEASQKYAAPHRAALIEIARASHIALASHDDATAAHVKESLEAGVSIAEFPTSVEAAEACHAAGVSVLMGAPNLVRGGSHSGNVAAEELARLGLLDIFSSDYVPASLLLAAFELNQRVPTISLPDAIATVTDTPARASGLVDRGRLEVGLRADFVRIYEADLPVVRGVWREGRRVA